MQTARIFVSCEDFVVFFTPKAFNNKALGQRRSRATQGDGDNKTPYAEGVTPNFV